MVRFALRFLKANIDDVQSMFDEEAEGNAEGPPISEEMIDEALSEIEDDSKYVVELWQNETLSHSGSGFRGRRYYAYGEEGEIYSLLDDAVYGASLACEEFALEPGRISIYRLVQLGREEYQGALSTLLIDEG